MGVVDDVKEMKAEEDTESRNGGSGVDVSWIDVRSDGEVERVLGEVDVGGKDGIDD